MKYALAKLHRRACNIGLPQLSISNFISPRCCWVYMGACCSLINMRNGWGKVCVNGLMKRCWKLWGPKIVDGQVWRARNECYPVLVIVHRTRATLWVPIVSLKRRECRKSVAVRCGHAGIDIAYVDRFPPERHKSSNVPNNNKRGQEVMGLGGLGSHQ